MTTWPGFGEGTFHDPDRYVREGREKDDPFRPVQPYAVHYAEPYLFAHPVPADVYQLCHSCRTLNVSPQGLQCCLKCGSEVSLRNDRAGADHPAVARAMEILYPEDG